jgi:hypothetical protein
MPALLGAASVAVLSLVAVGASSATGASSDDPKTDAVIVECRSDVVTNGDVSMSAMSVTRVDAVPAEIPRGCRVQS